MRPLALVALALLLASGARSQDLAFRLPEALGVPAPPLAPPDALAPEAAGDDWLGRDKALHLGVSFGLTVGGYLALSEGAGLDRTPARPLAAGLALGAGLAKEYADERRPHRPLFSWKDLAADALGVGLGIAATAL